MTKERLTYTPCIVPNCDRRKTFSPYCASHGRRFKLYGDPLQNAISYGDTVEEKFWSRVALTADDQRCWEWKGLKIKHEYGMSRYQGKDRMAHHISWYLQYGYFPAQFLLHSCDNPPCVNPNHLREGYYSENAADMISRNRQAFGERSGRAKLKDADIPLVREMVVSISQRAVGRHFGVSHTVIQDILRGKTWKHVK